MDTDRDSLPLGAITSCLASPYSRINPSAWPMISLHYDPDGTAIVSSKLLSQERFDWLSLQYHLHAPLCSPPSSRPCALYCGDIVTHLLRPINYIRGRHLNPRHHMVMPRAITQVLLMCSTPPLPLTVSSLPAPSIPPCSRGLHFALPLRRMRPLGPHHGAFSFRWTGTCSAHPAPVPEDMHRAVSHAVASAGHSDTPFLCFLVLPSWERAASWKSKDVLGSQDIVILLRLSKRHLKLVLGTPKGVPGARYCNPNKLRPTH